MDSDFSNEADRPPSITTIKRLAKHLRLLAPRPIRHSKALDLAAAMSGYADFKSAHAILEAGKPSQRERSAINRAYWEGQLHGRWRDNVPVLELNSEPELRAPVPVQIRKNCRRWSVMNPIVAESAKTEEVRPNRPTLTLVGGQNVRRSAPSQTGPQPPDAAA